MKLRYTLSLHEDHLGYIYSQGDSPARARRGCSTDSSCFTSMLLDLFNFAEAVSERILGGDHSWVGV